MKILIRNLQRHRSLNKERVLKTAGQILSLLEQTKAELSIMFVGDRKMKQLNTQYRGIRNTTDVLSFESAIPFVPDEADHALGDIVISVPKAEAQAKEYGSGFHDEITRLLIHGTLHLLGYDHEQTAYKARKMIKKEEELIDAIKKMD
ncbi:MAG TPA: rRNA maturation RNase YbeY [Nitrospirae bacterium]|nr:endoribonuclease YbeY [bacterium BMS3Bbin09]HDN94885.1 rRNA maturation RNase YbeY [Nitrospirota bacterium]HDO67117.1 rRNA maturation RNase YbeY [Nitrospirota bacterium]HDZ84270.1 rRNA maturation RNase YbeY [Nitrospirota bacterium]HEW81291.1 rRNA maturation RNase YbeY [Nitrospirota bacterium]